MARGGGARTGACAGTRSATDRAARAGAVLDGVVLFDDVTVGPGAIVKRAIIDKNVRIPAGARVGVDLEEDRKRFAVTDSGIVAVRKNQSFD